MPMSAPPSPATWHVVFWVLASLAISSMAQPSGKLCYHRSRYRVYLASSPILCVADAVSMTARLCVIMCGLRIDPRKASQLVLLARSEHVSSGVHTAENPSARSQSHTWPRVLFFIMGTLPAAIKLASLVETPWTKTWGMMFAASFMAIELITLLAHPREAVDELAVATILDLDLVGRVYGIQQSHVLRAKLARLSRRADILEFVLCCVAYLAHTSLIVWTVKMLWTPVPDAMRSSENAQMVVNYIKTSLNLLIMPSLLMIATWLLLRRCTSLPWGTKGRRVLWWLLRMNFALLFLPDKHLSSKSTSKSWDPAVPAWLTNILDHMAIWMYLYAFFYSLYWTLHSICARWPIIAMALLLEPDEKETEQAEGQQQDSDVVLEADKEPIEGAAWASLMFFLTNLSVCILWYTFMYDSTGTINPAWTDVFG